VVDENLEADVEDWGWGEFVDHTEEFAEFPSTPRCSPRDPKGDGDGEGDDGEDDDLSLVEDDPFNEKTDLERVLERCLREIVSKVVAMNQEDSPVGLSPSAMEEETSESSQSRKSSRDRDDRSSPSFVMVEERSVSEEGRSVSVEERSEGSIGRESSTESDDRSGVVVMSEGQERVGDDLAEEMIPPQGEEVDVPDPHHDASALPEPQEDVSLLLLSGNQESEFLSSSSSGTPLPEVSSEDPLIPVEREEVHDQMYIFPNPQELSDESGKGNSDGDENAEKEINVVDPGQDVSDVYQPDDPPPPPPSPTSPVDSNC
jgi:hypothetical protein